jgi:WD40 repeat protein
LWDFSSGDEVHAFRTNQYSESRPTAGDVIPNGQWAAAGDGGGLVYVWDLRPAMGVGVGDP